MRQAPFVQPPQGKGLPRLINRLERFIDRTVYCTLQGRDRSWLSHRYIVQCFGERSVDVAAVEFSLGLEKQVPIIMRQLGIPYVLFMHNIEFLVPRERHAEQTGRDFILERDAIEGAVHCVAISNTDARVAGIFNQSVSVLPYFPSKRDAARFHNIFGLREAADRHHKQATFVIMGTVGNWPTLVGMRELLERVCNRYRLEDAIKFKIAGYNTEQYFTDVGCCQVLGSIADAELDKLLVDCAAVIIQQAPTSGFLTRLVEFNLAGVPVAVNRGYDQAVGMEKMGIFTYESFAELEELLPRLMATRRFERFDEPRPDDLGALREIFDRGNPHQ